jgi:RNA polymerase sigma-70 factor (ECF subfamily)
MAVAESAATSASSGDAAPFEQVYRAHFAFVFRSLLRLGVPGPAVEDAVQDVFVAVHRQLGGFEARSSMRGWLFGIARRVAFRHRRTAQRVARKAEALAHNPAESTATPIESLESAQRDALLLRALDELDEDKRAALTLHVFEELPGPALAEILGVNVDTAYSRIKAARRELGRRLVALGVADEVDRLIARTRHATRPDPGARRRVAGLLALRLSDGGAAGATTGTATTGALVGIKGGLAAVALGAALAVGLGLVAPFGDRPPAVSHALPTDDDDVPDAAVVATRPEPAELAPNVAPSLVPSTVASAASEAARNRGRPSPAAPPSAATAPARDRRGSPTDLPPTATDTLAAALAEEVALITAAKAALDDGAPERALARLAEHATRFARGQLANERAGYRAIALCVAGQLAAGRREAESFLSHGGVSLAGRVHEACSIADAENPTSSR